MSQFQIYNAEELFNKYKALCESVDLIRIKYFGLSAICQNDMKLSRDDLVQFANDNETVIKLLESQIEAIKNLKGQVVKHIGECSKNPRSDL